MLVVVVDVVMNVVVVVVVVRAVVWFQFVVIRYMFAVIYIRR